MAIRFLSFLLLTSICAATAVLIYDGTWLAPEQSELASSDALNFELRSVVFGLAIGIIIGQFASIRWSQIPQDVIDWCTQYGATLTNVALAIGLMAVLVLY